MPVNRASHSESGASNFRYNYAIDISKENRSHTKILKRVEKNQVILEIGCSTGYMTEYMNTLLGCRVIGVEIDAVAAEKARPFCEKLIVGDVEQLSTDDMSVNGGYHGVIMADVLEHLKDAGKTLRKIRRLLRNDGYILLSVPNGAHGAISAQVLDGKWEYRDDGLLDATHLHFFDKDKLTALLENCGYFTSELDRVIIHPRDTEMKTPWNNYPRQITAYIEKVNPEYQTYQFIVKAYPASDAGSTAGLKNALAAEQNKVEHLKNDNRQLSRDLGFFLGEVSGFEQEMKKRQHEYRQNVDRLTETFEKEKSDIHTGYRREILALEDEKKEIHQHYREKMDDIQQKSQKAEKKLRQDMAKLDADWEQISDNQRMQIRELQLEAGHLKTVCSRKNDEIAHLNDQNANLRTDHSALQEQALRNQHELEEIKQSIFWRLITRYRQLIEWLLPHGSRRRRLYRLCVLAPVVLVREGPGSFARKIRKRLPVPGKPEGFQQTEEQHETEWFPISLAFTETPVVSIVIPVYNQVRFTFKCLQSIIEHTRVAHEVIVVNNASQDDTPAMLSSVKHIRVINNQDNKGFVDACNQGADIAGGEYILFLNNDTEVTAGWLNALLETFDDPDTGAVGAKLVYPDGRLQEAGNIIWKDGTGWNYGRGDDPNRPEYNYVRQVDYCSGACLMVRKSIWKQAGGFDRRYVPAYYEDTDLCFTVRSLGYRVVYQPEAQVIHYEGVSAGTDITQGLKKYQQINLAHFKEKWQHLLEQNHFSGPDQLYLARERETKRRAIVVDHFVPTYDKDSGSVRMLSILKILQELNFKVVFWPENRAYHDRYTRQLQRMGIEAMYGDIDFETYLKANGKHIDLIILSRPYVAINFIYAARNLTDARIIYDTVDLHFLRESRRVQYEVQHAAEHWKNMELFLAHQSDDTLVVSPVEKQILEQETRDCKVSVISNIHSLECCHNSYDKRKGLMFIGGFMHPPNEDGIIWFVKSIFGQIAARIPDIHLYVVGSNPTDPVKSLASDRVTVTGYVEDVTPYFEQARVFVSPLRYGAGVKGKIGQSMSYGLPVVTTSIGAEGMNLKDGETAMIADEESAFADKVIEVYHNRMLWENLSLNARKLIENQFSPRVMKQKLRELIDEQPSNQPPAR